MEELSRTDLKQEGEWVRVFCEVKGEWKEIEK